MKKLVLGFICSLLLIASVKAQTKDDVAKKYAAVISFHSFGEGTPSDRPLKEYIDKFKRKYKIKSLTADRMGPFGREGEYKLGFMLNELTVKQRRNFLTCVQDVVLNLNDKGNADMLVNVEINPKEINDRATAEIVKF